MYYIMHCFSPTEGDLAMLTYKPDHPFRSWSSGTRFSSNPNDPPFRRPPPEPVRANVKPGYDGVMAEFWDNPVPLMTQRLFKALQAAGVTNIDAYQAEIIDPAKQTVHKNYVAFNIVGKIAAADLKSSTFDASLPERMISMDFGSVTIDEQAARGGLLFRLAESVNAIVVHERIRESLETNGINTLTFVPPEQWAG
jgi:hypothetical protein